MHELEYRELTQHDLSLEQTDKPNLTGYAAVFDSLSENLGNFKERIVRGAFKRSLEENPDIWFFVNHDSEKPMGRTSTGTLKLSEDIHGLRIENDPPATSWANDAIASIKHGDAQSMSFGFHVNEERYLIEEGHTIRELLDIDLREVSLVYRPAYAATSISVRVALEAIAKAEALKPQEPEPEAEQPWKASLNLLSKIQKQKESITNGSE